ncbi:ABC transporter ATP-binding protein [Geodermatophilus poikilotrophus]|uniref:ABC-2 type transport system ATP-binding protein n=1 Tax=Geodermatophilus poikilotrophus TaxID=1333667 RepID=A0A1I0I362_9ACTN|nr:ABC transporter ATP-binding protein [Geodermatophilus poikilotrophus]SET91043.1 ABC-2 type transport system ATP-binding protein [Geodermatophilus poikilotrophus]
MDTGGAQRPADPAVQVTDLVKRYPGRPVNAVDGISFAVQRGEVFGLLGPNGAGKTTTIGVLTTRVLPTSGAASVAGVDVAADPVTARSRLSVVPQRPNLDRALTARQNLVFHAAYHGVGRAERNRRADALLEQLGLGGRGGDKVDDYSGGMAQRLLIARALMHAPQVVFLDEPSTGLDPQARLFVWDRVRELRDGGITVLLTTHDMDEAATLSDRVGIMDSGRLLALDTPAALTRSLPGSATLDIDVERAPEDTGEAVLAALASLAERVEQVEQVADGSGLRARLYLSGDAAALVGPVSEALAARRARLTGVRIGEPSLEDVFLSLTGRELR